MIGSHAWSSSSSLTLLESEEETIHAKSSPFSFQIRVDFMEKLAAKPYLYFSSQTSNSPASSVLRRSTKPTSFPRPPGVPDNLRILVVDLPEIVERGFTPDDSCHKVYQNMFDDGVAPPAKAKMTVSKVRIEEGDDSQEDLFAPVEDETKTIDVDVPQKTWVKALHRCVNGATGKVGVQIMEASTEKLNPHNIRRVQQFGTLRHDPGQYEDRKKGVKAQNVRKKRNEEWFILEAPWNQYAWKDELELRISGKVGFGDPLETHPRPWWSRLFFSNDPSRRQAYKATVPSQRSWLDNVFWWRLSDPAGLDGAISKKGEYGNNWASHKPHAVVADALSMQRQPQSIRLLQEMCLKYDVPLYIIRDPRSWGSNTHEVDDDLGPLLKDLRQEIKSRIVTNSLQQSAGTAFQRGFYVGRLEANAEWKAGEIARQTQMSVREAALKRSRKAEDWSLMDERALEEKLMEHNVLKRPRKNENTTTTNGFLKLARRIVQEYAYADVSASESKTPEASSTEGPSSNGAPPKSPEAKTLTKKQSQSSKPPQPPATESTPRHENNRRRVEDSPSKLVAAGA